MIPALGLPVITSNDSSNFPGAINVTAHAACFTLNVNFCMWIIFFWKIPNSFCHGTSRGLMSDPILEKFWLNIIQIIFILGRNLFQRSLGFIHSHYIYNDVCLYETSNNHILYQWSLLFVFFSCPNDDHWCCDWSSVFKNQNWITIASSLCYNINQKYFKRPKYLFGI